MEVNKFRFFFLVFFMIVIYYSYLCMSVSDEYLGFLHVSREYGIYYLKMPINIVQYRGAVGNFNNRKFFNAKAVNKIFGHRYWMPTNTGTVLLLLTITLCAARHKSSKTSNNISFGILYFNILLILKLPLLSNLIMLCGDVELNRSPKTISQQSFSVCHWNLNSIQHLRIILPK